MATQSVTISLATIRTEAVRTINVFAKRYAVQGENKFTFVALSTEEEALLTDFALKAVHEVASHVAQMVTAYTNSSEGTVTFTATNTRWGDELGKAFADSVKDYCVTTAVADYFGLYFPNQARFFQERANSFMTAVLRLTFIKQSVEPTGTLSQGSVTVTTP